MKSWGCFAPRILSNRHFLLCSRFWRLGQKLQHHPAPGVLHRHPVLVGVGQKSLGMAGFGGCRQAGWGSPGVPFLLQMLATGSSTLGASRGTGSFLLQPTPAPGWASQ